MRGRRQEARGRRQEARGGKPEAGGKKRDRGGSGVEGVVHLTPGPSPCGERGAQPTGRHYDAE